MSPGAPPVDRAVSSVAPLPARANVVVVGAGIMGLSVAHNLAKLGVERICVLDASYLCSGASGRNGGGVRAQWSNETNIRLMRRSIALCESFATDMRINVWFRQSGYLFVARSDERMKQLAASAELQREHGLPTRLLDPGDIRKLAPELDVSGIVGASYNPEDGVVFPWPFVWGYARACQKQGVSIHTHTRATALETEGNRVTGVVTPRGVIETPQVICAMGAWSPELTKTAGVELPSRPHRHEICSTEPLKPFLKPFVGDLASGLYFSQSMRGELVGGISNDAVPSGVDQGSSLRFLALYARALTALMPRMSGVRVLRQWAGCYDMTPDGNPLIGRVDELDGLILTSGFMGHGFMMAPVMGELIARHLVFDEEEALFERWNLRRYREGNLLEETMILG